jgi:hypothetical protein
MTAKDKKDVAGKALYLEFRKGQYTYQVITTPLTVGADNSTIVPFTTLRRRISTWHPRRNWGVDKSRLTGFSRDAYGDFEKDTRQVRDADLANLVGSLMTNQFASLVSQGWELYKHPLVVEFNYDELDIVHNGKMPVPLYRRIERVRKNQGWPESLVNPEEETTV